MNQIEKNIDIATWKRREHYEHFSAFDDPFFGVTVNVDCTRAYQEAKDKGVSFSLLVLHRIVTAAAAVEEFRYRIEGNRVVCYDKLVFIRRAKAEMERLQATTGLNKGGTFHPNAIHYSAVPWLSFTDMKHPTNMRSGDSVPKISTGKYFREGERLMMPVSVTCHHGLMDGYHVAQFIEKLHL